MKKVTILFLLGVYFFSLPGVLHAKDLKSFLKMPPYLLCLYSGGKNVKGKCVFPWLEEKSNIQLPLNELKKYLCISNEDCPKKQFCYQLGCRELGICVDIPQFCPSERKVVCGCDFKNYKNACFAYMNKTGVSHEGECIHE